VTIDLAGRALGDLFGAVGRVRRPRKPLHPHGTVLPASLTRSGLDEPCGIAWLDEPGRDDVLVRFSRGAGLPDPLPDVLGLAMRIPMPDGRHADLLFASTGMGRLTRFLLRPGRNAAASSYSTLLPYRAPEGPLFLSCKPAVAERGVCFELGLAVGVGPWRVFGQLDVPDAEPAQDADITFDPMTNTLPDLQPADWVVRIRERAYRKARQSRGDERPRP
jgi:hypothetical protein